MWDRPKPCGVDEFLQLQSAWLHIITLFKVVLLYATGIPYVIFKSSWLITFLRFLLFRQWLKPSDFIDVKECVHAATSHTTKTLLTGLRHKLVLKNRTKSIINRQQFQQRTDHRLMNEWVMRLTKSYTVPTFVSLNKWCPHIVYNSWPSCWHVCVRGPNRADALVYQVGSQVQPVFMGDTELD